MIVSSEIARAAIGAVLCGAHAVGAPVDFHAASRITERIEPDPEATEAYRQLREEAARIDTAVTAQRGKGT